MSGRQEATMRGLGIMAAIEAVVVIGVMATPVSAANWADALFVEKAHDFGPVPRGAKVHHEFVLTNRLREPITIVNVRASCGCTTGRALASVVPAGQAAAIEAQMDTRNFVGKKATTLFVTLVTASGREAEARLGVSSTILSDIVLNPGTIDFGAVGRGQTPSQVLTIDRGGQPGWKVERMVSASRVLNAQLVETARNDATVTYSLTVSLKPETPAGNLRDEIRILTNDPETPSIPILVTAQVRGDLIAKPALLPLGRVNSSAGVQGRFLVMGSQPFTIRSVEGAGDGFRVGPLDPASKSVHVVTIAYRPDEGTTRGDLRRVFRVHTDLPREAPVEVTATLHAEP
jgi:hypothetical protein